MEKKLPSQLQSPTGLVDSKTLESAKVIALYFSALWCVPCKEFTKKLIQMYEEVNRSEQQFQVILVSGDLTDTDFDTYYKTMPWLAIPFEDEAGADLATVHKVTSMPVLILIDKDGNVKKDKANKDITDNPKATPTEIFEKWKSLY